MRTSSISILVLFLILGSVPFVYADHTSHDYVKKITIDNTDVDSTLTDFPLLLNFTDSDLSSRAFSDGLRITFTESTNSTELSHEIEQYTSGNGWLTAWVKVPSISSSSDTDIFMWYGNNTNLSDQQSITDTWRSEYVAVYHLNDDFLDSTSNNNDGTNSGSSDFTDQHIADSQDFDGINDVLDLGTDSSMDNLWDGGGTFTIWLNADSDGENDLGRIINSQDGGGNVLYVTEEVGGLMHMTFYVIWDSNLGLWQSTGAKPLSINEWHYTALTYDSDSTSNNPTILLDNTSVSLVEVQTPVGTRTTDAGNTQYVGNRGDTARTFDGTFDEIRWYDGTLSDAWLDFEYCNQVVTGTCEPLTVSAEGEASTPETHTIDVSEIQWIIDTDNVTLNEFFETHTINVSEIQWIIDSDTVLLNEGSEIHQINISEIQWIIDTDSVTNDFAGVYTPSGKYIWFNCSLASNSTQGCIFAFFCPPGQFVNGFWENGTASCAVP